MSITLPVAFIFGGICVTGTGFAMIRNATRVRFMNAGLAVVAAGLLAYMVGIGMAVRS